MKITNIQYTRNGSGCCEGFHQVFFNDGRTFKNMMAIAFSDRDQLAIVSLDNLTLKWEAQEWREKIYQAIDLYEGSWSHAESAYTIKFPFTI